MAVTAGRSALGDLPGRIPGSGGHHRRLGRDGRHGEVVRAGQPQQWQGAGGLQLRDGQRLLGRAVVPDRRRNQQWRFLDSGNGWYRLQNRTSGKVLDDTTGPPPTAPTSSSGRTSTPPASTSSSPTPPVATSAC
nr:RICIN domain-containing protein [Streptomyces sp. TLI_235]